MNTKREKIIKQIISKKNNSFWIIEMDNDQYLLCSRSKIQMLSQAEIDDFRDENIDEYSMPHSWMTDTETYFKNTEEYQKQLFSWMAAPEKPFFIEFEAVKITAK